jgi:flagellar biosynthesis protein FlhA
MAVDAELAAGSIDDAEARRRRDELARESAFHGSMDGAMKFVRGDAVAGLLITLINIVGGVAIGAVRHGMGIADAMGTFTVLTIGDGLVSQVPALMISIAAGLLVTRAAASEGMGAQLWGQIAARGTLKLAAVFLAGVGAIAMTQSLWLGLELFGAAALLGWLGRAPSEPAAAPPEPADPLRSLVQVEPLELAVGARFVPALSDRIPRGIEELRRTIAADLGMVLPSVRARDDMSLRPGRYVLRLRGAKLAAGEAPSAQALLDRVRRDLTRYAAEVLGHDDLRRLLELVRASHPALVEQVGEGRAVEFATLHRVARNLLAEGVPVRDLATVLETLASAPAEARGDAEALTELARRALARAIVERLQGPDGVLRAVRLEGGAEARLLAPESLQGLPARVILTAAEDRPRVRRLAEQVDPEIAVLSFEEVPRGSRVAIVSWPGAGN